MQEWQSGALPYPILLMSQIAILLVMLTIRIRVTTGSPLLPRHSLPYARPALVTFSILYGAVMVVRFGIWAWAKAHGETFLGGWIPPVFHCVLAGYLFNLASLLEGHSATTNTEQVGTP